MFGSRMACLSHAHGDSRICLVNLMVLYPDLDEQTLVEAEAEQKQCTEVLSRTLNPKWAASANKFKFEIADAHQMICIRMFAATQGGDVQLGNSAIRMHDAFGGGLDTGQHMVVSLDLPLLLARSHPNPYP